MRPHFPSLSLKQMGEILPVVQRARIRKEDYEDASAMRESRRVFASCYERPVGDRFLPSIVSMAKQIDRIVPTH